MTISANAFPKSSSPFGPFGVCGIDIPILGILGVCGTWYCGADPVGICGGVYVPTGAPGITGFSIFIFGGIGIPGTGILGIFWCGGGVGFDKIKHDDFKRTAVEPEEGYDKFNRPISTPIKYNYLENSTYRRCLDVFQPYH